MLNQGDIVKHKFSKEEMCVLDPAKSNNLVIQPGFWVLRRKDYSMLKVGEWEVEFTGKNIKGDSKIPNEL